MHPFNDDSEYSLLSKFVNCTPSFTAGDLIEGLLEIKEEGLDDIVYR